jgi:hypothetical protein
MNRLFILLPFFLLVLGSCQKKETQAQPPVSSGTAQTSAGATQAQEVTQVQAQNQSPPTYYLADCGGGVIACEFAENGLNGLLSDDDIFKEFEPYIQNGRFYFIGMGGPVESGPLNNGFKLFLSEIHNTFGVYQGSQKDTVDGDVWVVVGYAEHGKVSITNVFPLESESFEAWTKTVKTFPEMSAD